MLAPCRGLRGPRAFGDLDRGGDFPSGTGHCLGPFCCALVLFRFVLAQVLHLLPPHPSPSPVCKKKKHVILIQTDEMNFERGFMEA